MRKVVIGSKISVKAEMKLFFADLIKEIDLC